MWHIINFRNLGKSCLNSKIPLYLRLDPYWHCHPGVCHPDDCHPGVWSSMLAWPPRVPRVVTSCTWIRPDSRPEYSAEPLAIPGIISGAGEDVAMTTGPRWQGQLAAAGSSCWQQEVLGGLNRVILWSVVGGLLALPSALSSFSVLRETVGSLYPVLGRDILEMAWPRQVTVMELYMSCHQEQEPHPMPHWFVSTAMEAYVTRHASLHST